MAYEYTDPMDELQQRAFQSSNGYNAPPMQWDSASNVLNKYNDEHGGGVINWETAKSIYEQNAQSGQGNHGDWVNQTLTARDKWSTPNTPAYKPPTTGSSTQAWTRQNVRDTLSGYGAPSQDNLLRAVQENPWLGKVVGGGKIQDTQSGGTNEIWDVIMNLNDPTQTKSWGTLTGHTAAAKAAAAAKAPVKAVPAKAPVVNAASSTSSVSASDAALRQQLTDQLLERAHQSLAIDPKTDPTIRASADAYAANEERARRNYISDIAEEAGPLANIRGEERIAAERVGQRTGAYEADLVLREQTARRKEIQDALDSIAGLGMQDKELALRKELALMDDAINRLKLNQDQSQFTSNLGYRNRALDQSGSQYNSTLGYNYDVFDWDRSPMNPRNYPV